VVEQSAMIINQRWEIGDDKDKQGCWSSLRAITYNLNQQQIVGFELNPGLNSF
jgi:hypothetical protein